jgi:Na+-driven multidrug efflux pump
MVPFAGFQVVSSNFFVVTGRPKMSIFLTMLRQFIAYIPCLLLFGRLWGLWGLISAQPVADLVAVGITSTFIFREMRKLRRMAKAS